MTYNQGDPVDTPLGPGTVCYRWRDAETGRYAGTIFAAKDVRLHGRILEPCKAGNHRDCFGATPSDERCRCRCHARVTP